VALLILVLKAFFSFLLRKCDCFLIEKQSHWGTANPEFYAPEISKHAIQSPAVRAVQMLRPLPANPRFSEHVGVATLAPPGWSALEQNNDECISRNAAGFGGESQNHRIIKVGNDL